MKPRASGPGPSTPRQSLPSSQPHNRPLPLLAAALLGFLFVSPNPALQGAPNQALIPVGVAQIDVTPTYPVRLSGFGGRRTESEGVTQRIWAKALAFGDDQLGPAIIITTDNLGVSDEITQAVAQRLARSAGLKLERLSITASHTHTAPMLKNVAPTLFGTPIPPEHQTNIDRYTREFTDKLEQVALNAIRDLRPAHVSWGIGSVAFATNRRTPGGPVDHDLPVMTIRDPGGATRAVYFSYACHCVTLSHNQISGDWAGYAMEQVQEKFPGAIALASAGCGADSNPTSGVTGARTEVARAQGQQIATEVARLLETPLATLTTRPSTKLTRIQLPFAAPRTRTEWEERAKSNDAVGYHARVNLARLDRGEPLPTGIDYAVQTWTFGTELALVFLPGEVVVDYSLRLKRQYDRNRIWVNAYANDAPCYIPSERVLQEGGYEGGSAMIYYDKPREFAPGLEQRIIDTLRTQIPDPFLVPQGTEGTSPRSPNQALHTFQTKPGLELELVAAEPLISSPVAIDWDAAGRLWVCEMLDYPTGLDENWQPGGRIKQLRDTDGDGTFDQAVVFLDHLPFPTGLMVWGRGVLICAAPDILHAEDTNNDGRADRVEKLFSGFAAGNYQARVNSLSLGLDNWIYGANGLLGGTIDGPAGSIDIRGHDFRFRFAGGLMETVNGLSQQGRVRDDWGRWFGCNNGSALDYYPDEARYLRRNPAVSAPPSSISPAASFDAGRVYPASRTLERFNDPEAANRITSGCGLGLYRDTLLGAGYYNNAFTCEPVHNLVHRLALDENGLELTRRRPADEAQSEFLTSTDNWSRPVQVRTGPDGALYVVDLYRFLVEHPRWIPAARLARINVRAGAGMGRIYRLRPLHQPLRPVPDLTQLNGSALAAALDSPNGTERDRVQIELLHRRDPSAIPELKRLASQAHLAQVRLQSLSVLDGMNELNATTLTRALTDTHEQVRAEAVRLTEPFLREDSAATAEPGDRRPLLSSLLSLTNDTSLRVARQLAFTLGESKDPRAGRALAHLARRWPNQHDVRNAVLSSASHHAAGLLNEIITLNPNAPEAAAWFPPLVATVAASDDESLFNNALLSLLSPNNTIPDPNRFAALTPLLDSLDRRQITVRDYFQSHPQLRRSEPQLHALIAAAGTLATNAAASTPTREAAVQLIGRASAPDEHIDLLCALLTGPTPGTLRAATLVALGRQRSPRVPGQLLSNWAQTSPATRQEIVNLLLGRDDWTLLLLQSINEKTVQPREIPLADRQRISQSSDHAVRQLAATLFPPLPTTARTGVLNRYQDSLSLTGDHARGRELFASSCMSCHALDGIGHDVGPGLAPLRAREPDYWLKNILDPNAVVEPRFVAYEIETSDDRTLSGIIRTETASSLTLVSGNGLTEIIPRSTIRDIRASDLSLMPEGLEETITPQDMADLLAFLIPRHPPTHPAGNTPGLVTPGPGGLVLLPASRAEILGGDITFESPFGNIGMWHGQEDHVAWTFQVDEPGPRELHIDFACADGSAGNPYRITVAEQAITGTIPGTGPGWNQYVQRNAGTVDLKAGRHRLTVRPDAKPRGALMDLRALALVPPGRLPPWPAAAPTTQAATTTTEPEQLLRDAPSIARYLLDPASPDQARDAVIRANPQFAAQFITEMTRDLQPGTPQEYERIPWIWRVAISCGKRNDPVEIQAVLETSLPQPEQPLHHWQAVVIGGGIINGLSQRGLWPAQHLETLLARNLPLLDRWNRALNLAASMSDDITVPSGTRYDALRMLAMEPWEKRGGQLVRYLAEGTPTELQMGAVSGLADLPSPHATSALLAALGHLTGGNRDLALDALVRHPGRASALLDHLQTPGWKGSPLGSERTEQLRNHPDPAVRNLARKLLPPS